jgi:FixJ family two-component response regulator
MPARPPIIAVVDDDEASLRALGRVLQMLGFEAALYCSLEAFRAAPPDIEPLCLLFDAHVQRPSAFDLQQRVAAVDASIPVIVMTDLEDPRLRDGLGRLGWTGYFDKSSDIDGLLALIDCLHRRSSDA